MGQRRVEEVVGLNTSHRLSLIVTTVGRLGPFARLIRSLEASKRRAEVEVIAVDQSPGRACAAWLEVERPELAWRTTISPPGASAGRNAGLHLAVGELVGFPDDDCWYEPDTIDRVVARFDRDPDLTVLSGRALTADGRPSMLRWPDASTPITASNYYRTAVAYTLFVRRPAVTAVGGFNETIGTGAPGWLGAGEESDLVLRLLAVGSVAGYEPDIVVHHEEPRDEAGPELATKMLRYGCGQGHLWRVHAAPAGHIAYRLARKVAGAGLRYATGRPEIGRADAAFVRGCIAGLRDRPPRSLRASALALEAADASTRGRR
jgi:hypothetical protein